MRTFQIIAASFNLLSWSLFSAVHFAQNDHAYRPAFGAAAVSFCWLVTLLTSKE